MSAELSDDLKKLIDDAPVFAAVATLQPDGSPQMSVTWITHDGNDLLIATGAESRKAKNLRRDPRVTVMINPPNAPYTYVEVRGTATVSAEGGRELLDELSRKYTGLAYADFDPAQGDMELVAVRVTPVKVVGSL
ncbi:PPOX class F420-dependent oxidoreductase [Streptomyces stramineus]|uniref:Pyridoxamine 5'-phosphate oxidase N-terminal domain-containing protein n=1 Tax=Streptomyces stramineus TaxID=173861 RepID=A0ABP3JE84_9ACTN